MKKKFFTPQSHRVYILPTKLGLLYAVGDFGLLFAASTYSNNLVYLIFFITTVLGILAMHQTNENLKGIKVKEVDLPATGAGQSPIAQVYLRNETQDPKYSLSVSIDKKREARLSNLLPLSLDQTSVPLRPRSRGVYSIKRIKLYTTFPLGLFYSWTYQDINETLYVYPQPKGPYDFRAYCPNESMGEHSKGLTGIEFKEHKKFQTSDGYRKVDWKAYAKHREKLTKHFLGESEDSFLLDFQNIPLASTEDKLSQLSLWIKQLSEKRCHFSLKLPHFESGWGNSRQHQMGCLKRLAQYETGDLS